MNNINIVEMLECVQKWNKSPSLDHNLHEMLEIFRQWVHTNSNNKFIEAGLFLQETSIFYGKFLDLLYKEILTFHKRLCDAYNDDGEERVPETSENLLPRLSEPSTSADNPIPGTSTDVDPSLFPIPSTSQAIVAPPPAPVKKVRKERKKKKPEEIKKIQEDQVQKHDELDENIRSFLQQLGLEDDDFETALGIPKELVNSLRLNDWLPGGQINEAVENLSPDHPLYEVFNSRSKELSKNNEVFTVNNISLSKLSWKVFYKVEQILKHRAKLKENSEVPEAATNATNQQENTSQNDLTTNENKIITDNDATAPNENVLQVDNATEKGIEPGENAVAAPEQIENNPVTTEQSADDSVMAEQMESDSLLAEHAENDSQMDISLTNRTIDDSGYNTTLDNTGASKKVLDKKTDKETRKSDRLKTKIKYDDDESKLKRKVSEESLRKLLKKVKTVNFDDFEQFYQSCIDDSEDREKDLRDAGKINGPRKSVDTRSEISYGNPLTPADSGRFSLSFLTDSEEFEDPCESTKAQHCNDGICQMQMLSRPDSGLDCASPIASPASHHHIDADVDGKPQVQMQEPVDCEKPSCSGVNSVPSALDTFKNMFPEMSKVTTVTEHVEKMQEYAKHCQDMNSFENLVSTANATENDFDIHEHESKIMDAFPKLESNEVSFTDVVKLGDTSVQEISKLFVSLLQLGNSGNVEIVNDQPGELCTGLKLKFLSNDRAHEAIDTHMNDIAEENFFDRFASTSHYNSTPVQPMPPPAPKSKKSKKSYKKRKLDYGNS